MTRQRLSTLVLACLAALFGTASAQDGFVGPQGYAAPPELLPQDRGFAYDNDSPIDLAIKETLARSYYRIEYLNWSLTDPGNVFLGERMQSFDLQGDFPGSSGIDPNTQAFPIQDANGFRISQGYVPDLGDADFAKRNGIRGTIGLPFQGFTIETTAWTLEAGDSTLNLVPDTTFGTPFAPVVTFLANGQLSDSTMVPFEGTYNAFVSRNLFGGEVNAILDPINEGLPIKVQPIAGIRYLRHQNKLSITGYDAPTDLNHVITSDSENNNIGPTLGMRFGYDSKYLSLAVDPKFTFGINRHRDVIRTAQLFSTAELPTTVGEEDTDFAPIFEVNPSIRVHMGPSLSVFVSYNLIAMAGQINSWQNIIYDTPADPVTNGPAMRMSGQKSTLVMQGITVGAEFRFR
jgi:hypothetical protein